MQKPIMVARKEFIEKMTNVINESGLSMLVVEPILRDLLDEVRLSLKQQYELELKQYEESLNVHLQESGDQC